MWKTLTRATVIVFLAGSAALAPTPVAAAPTTSLAACPANSLCGWSGTYFTGAMTTFSLAAGCTNAPTGLRSVANTWPSGTGVTIVMLVYSGSNCTGAYLGSVGRGQSLPSLPTWGFSVSTVV